MRLNILLPLTILILLTGCGAVKTDDKVETKQPNENSKSEHKLYDKTFETELVKDDGLVQIRVHNELGKDDENHYTGLYTYIDIIKDDTVIDTLDTGIYMKYVTDISFFDFDCDGRNDIAITGDAPKFLLCNATSDYHYSVYDPWNIVDNIEEQRGNDFSMDKLKSVLLGNNLSCDYSDYKKLYSQMARLFKLQAYYDPSYDLIDIDGNDPLELVARSGCRVMLCSYKDGRVNEVFENLDGASGCLAYEYSPGNGIIRWEGSSSAGAYRYTGYSLLHKRLNEDEWGYCDYTFDEVLYDFSKEKETYSSCYSNNTDETMSDDELKKLVDGYSNLDYKFLGGSLGYDEFMKELEE